MDASKKQREPVAFKSLAELKRFIRPGVEFKTVSHANHADMVGLTRVVTTVQTVGFYSKIKDQPEHPFSTCNHGKGFYTDFGKAGNYIFDGTTVKVKDILQRLDSVAGAASVQHRHIGYHCRRGGVVVAAAGCRDSFGYRITADGAFLML